MNFHCVMLKIDAAFVGLVASIALVCNNVKKKKRKKDLFVFLSYTVNKNASRDEH